MTNAVDIRLVRTEDVSRGIGSSRFVDWLRSGRNGLYGSGCSRRFGVREGTSMI